jgi:hypothetical protein
MRTWMRVVLALVAVVLVVLGLLFEALNDGLCEEPGCSGGIEPLTLQLVFAGAVLGVVAGWPRRRR